MRKLPILMYHNVCKDDTLSEGLYISQSRLENQIQFLISKGYNFLHFSDLEKLILIPQKSVVLTFDDVTENQYLLALPLLKKYNVKATFFVPFAYIGEKDFWNDGKEKIMSVQQLKTLNKDLIELGYHSYKHNKYSKMNKSDIDSDFELCEKVIKEHELNVFPVLAYPYGSYPKKEAEMTAFGEILKKNGIKFGLRIGNRPNRMPFKDRYKVKRIDIKGEDSLFIFKIKLKIGKLRLF